VIKLIGILIVVVGFVFRVDALLIVLIAGVITGLVSGLNFMEILSIMGKAFVDNRAMSLFVLTLPAIGLAEKHGLREQAAKLISSIKAATAGRIMSWVLIGALGLRLGGHAQFVRPLVAPMVTGAVQAKYGIEEIPEDLYEDLMGYSASSEFVAASGLLLIQGVFKEAGIEVDLLTMSRYAIPVGIFAIIYGTLQYLMLDRKIQKYFSERKVNANG